MNQPIDTQQAKGDFYAPLNRRKQPGDKQPIFKGRLNKPDDEAKLPIALWGFDYVDKKTGEVKRGFSGDQDGVASNIPAQAQIDALMADVDAGKEVTVANLTLRPGQITLFTNGFKDEAPERNRPDYWGWFNPKDGTPPVMVNIWVKTFEDSGVAYLSGKTQYPLPGKSLREQQDVAPPPELTFADHAAEPARKGRQARYAQAGRE